jgi:hypothetical protein
MLRRALVLMVIPVVVLITACGSSKGSGTTKGRPSTSARLEIVSPTPSEVTGTTVTLKFNLIGATILPPTQTTGPLRGDQGHIHVRLDGTLVNMAYSDQLPLTNLTVGTHTVQAEFVAVDHQPFSNTVTAAVVFQVKA